MITLTQVEIIEELEKGKSVDELVAKYGKIALEMHQAFVANQEWEAREEERRNKIRIMHEDQSIKDLEKILAPDLSEKELREAFDNFDKHIAEDIDNHIKTELTWDVEGNPEIIKGRVH